MELKLSERMYNFLKLKNEWVSKGTLSRLARSKGYSSMAIRTAFEKLEHVVDIGVVYSGGGQGEKLKKGTWFRWYKMTKKEKERSERAIAYFDLT